MSRDADVYMPMLMITILIPFLITAMVKHSYQQMTCE
uniref:Uncharacterized protein n=1 Tax=Arundo donax TaxID=35708 RepID=A0A0A9E8N6_ARUDO